MIFSKVLVALLTFTIVQLAQAKLPTSSIDCIDKDNREDAMCICRLQTNHHMPICKEFVDQNNGGVNQQIINGEEVEPNIHPWFARSTLGSDWAGCGGSLVTPEYVLTAAHCVDGRINNLKNNGGYQIGALCAPYGPNKSNNCGQAVQSFGISDIIPHPNYNSNNVQNDFALVRLDGSSTITPVTMDPGDISPSYENLSLKENLWPIGFGTDENGSVTSKLMRVNVNYVKQSTCNDNYNGGIFENMMCAADTNQDSCQGDSGGPLYDSDNDVLVGVVSWGRGCAQANFPGVYSRISNQISWIKEEICKSGAHNEPRPNFCDAVLIYSSKFDNDTDGFRPLKRWQRKGGYEGGGVLRIKRTQNIKINVEDIIEYSRIKIEFKFKPSKKVKKKDGFKVMIQLNETPGSIVWQKQFGKENNDNSFAKKRVWYDEAIVVETPDNATNILIQFEGLENNSKRGSYNIDNVVIIGLQI